MIHRHHHLWKHNTFSDVVAIIPVTRQITISIAPHLHLFLNMNTNSNLYNLTPPSLYPSKTDTSSVYIVPMKLPFTFLPGYKSTTVSIIILTSPYPYLCHCPSIYTKYTPLPYTPIPAPPLFISSLFNHFTLHHTCASEKISVLPATPLQFYSWRATTTLIIITVPPPPSLQSPCIWWSLHTCANYAIYTPLNPYTL